MSLWSLFLDPTHRRSIKWTRYFPIYERYMAAYVNKPCRMLEMGVWNGGSLQLWKRYLGPEARITGIDINPECKKAEEFLITVCIGNQADVGFLKSVHDTHGPFDIILDDASHIAEEALASFEFLYPLMPRYGVYMIEDLNRFNHSPAWGRRLDVLVLDMNRKSVFSDTTLAIHIYEHMVVFERSPNPGNICHDIGVPTEGFV